MSAADERGELKKFTLEGVTSLGKDLGRGAYGKVFTVKYLGLVCAAKEIHSLLLDGVSLEEKNAIKAGFIKECIRCNEIRHPNIVQFLGVYYTSERSDLPIMVMELMDISLNSFVEANCQRISLKSKFSILHDVSLGLSHLHGRKPPVIHRDLSSNNVLLTSHLVAKISDLGMAKMIRADSKHTKSRLTTAPGTLHFMPPEALENNPVYGTPVDVFSFAGIALHVFSEEWPNPDSQVKKNPKTKMLVALSEAERRRTYLNKLSGGAPVHKLKGLIEKCLENDPDERPSIQNVSEVIEPLKEAESVNAEKNSFRPPITPRRSIPNPKPRLQHNTSYPKNVKSTATKPPPPVPVRPKSLYNNPTALEEQLQNIQLEVQKNRASQSENISVAFKQSSPNKIPVILTRGYRLNWKACRDLPTRIYDASVAVDGNDVYVTGFTPNSADECRVFHYDGKTNRWVYHTEPGHRYGILCMVGDYLTIFGGWDVFTNAVHNKVSSYNKHTKSWEQQYPNMICARHKPAIITHDDYVIAIGGKGHLNIVLDSIEMLNFKQPSQWREISSCLPVPMWGAKTSISADDLYIIGYSSTEGLYSASFNIPVCALILAIDQPLIADQIIYKWKRLPPAPFYGAAVVPYSNPPLSIGGSDQSGTVPTATISYYDTSKESWAHVNFLTSAKKNIGVASISSCAIILVGGNTTGGSVVAAKASSLSTVEIGYIEHD